LIAAGSTLSISQPVAGDLFAAAGTLDVHGEVGGDALLAGGTVGVNAVVRNGVYGVGGRVTINAPVQRNVRIAGGSIEIGPQAKITGNVAAAGGDVTVHGPIDGYLRVGAGRILINAAVGGDVEVGTGSLELGPNARITGKLRYASSAPLRRDAAARTDGGVDRVEPPKPSLPSPVAHSGLGGASWLWTGGLALLAAVLALALPEWYARVAETLQRRPGVSALVGFIVLVCVPVAALLLLVTIIGVPLALGVLLLYPLVLLVGYASTAVALGRMALALDARAAAARGLARTRGGAGDGRDRHRRARAVAGCDRDVRRPAGRGRLIRAAAQAQRRGGHLTGVGAYGLLAVGRNAIARPSTATALKLATARTPGAIASV